MVDCRDWFCEEGGWVPEEWRRLGSPETEVSMPKNSDYNAFVDAEEDTCSDCQDAAIVAVHAEASEFEGADEKDSSCGATASANVATTSSRLAAAAAASFVAADEAAVVGHAASFESARDLVRTRAANAETRCVVSLRTAGSAEVRPGSDNS